MLTRLLDLDHLVRAWVVAHRVRALDAVMVALSASGRGGLVWLAIGAVLTALRVIHWRRFVELCAALLLTSLIVDYAVKPLVDRPRPFTSMPSASVIVKRPDDPSFPSGHSGNAFAGAIVLSRALPPWQPVWWALAVLIALSRVYVGVHYPADIVGGAIVGAAAALAVLRASAAFTRSGVKGT